MAKRLENNFTFVGTKQEILSGQNRPILPTRVANQNTGFTSSCLLTDQPYNKTDCYTLLTGR